MGAIVKTVSSLLIAITLGAGIFLAGVHLGAKSEAMGPPLVAMQRIISYAENRNQFGKFGKTYEGTVKQEALRCAQLHNAVVFIGDSNTYGLATSNIVARAEDLGVNGDTIENVEYRLKSCDLHGASAIVVAIGTNNWPYDHYADFAAKYRELLRMLPAGTPVVAAAILPVNEKRLSAFYDTRGMDQGIAAADREIAEDCHKDRNCTFAPVPRSLEASNGELATWADAGEGVHLSAPGYLIWGKALGAAVARAEHH